MLLSSLTIKNFRALHDFSVPRLGRVNLIVGKNNSGKSTVLEALRIFAKQGHPELLRSVLSSHDESSYSRYGDTNDFDTGVDKAFRHFFPGRYYPITDNCPIYVGDIEQNNFVSLEHVNFTDEVEEIKDAQGELTRLRRRKIVSKDQLSLERGQQFLSQGIVVTSSSSRTKRQGWIDLREGEPRYGATRNSLFWEEVTEIPLSHVPTQFMPRQELAAMWDSIALTNGDDFVIKALQVIEPTVEGLAFVRREHSRQRSSEQERIAIIKLANQDSPIPLNGMGDGMLRVLQLILALFPAQGGFMLIDEFENGLHFSVQQDTWKLLFQLAHRFNVQIFATTHSWDCIAAYKNVVSESQEDGVLFRVGKSIRKSTLDQVIATTFSGTELAELTQAQVEVR